MKEAVLISYTGEPKYYAHLVPDLSIAYLTAAIKNKGYNCKFFDLNLISTTEQEITDYVLKNKPDFIGMKLFGNGFESLAKLAGKIKELWKEALVVGGGPQVTLFKEQIFNFAPDFDFLFYGEGEIAVSEFIDYIEGKRTIQNVRNLIRKEDNQVILNTFKLTEDIDSLPLPDWSAFELHNYFPLFLINMKRGCQFQCAFCSHNYFWGRETGDHELEGKDMDFIRSKNSIRKRTWESVKKEVDNNLFEHKVRLMEVVDSTPDIPLMRKFSDYVIEKKLPVKWVAFDRINYCNFELYKKYAESGCVALWYGVESGNREILKTMGKTYSIQDIKSTISKAKKVGIKTICAIIVGFPGETEQTMLESLNLMNEINPDIKDIIPFFLQKGSPIAFNPQAYGVEVYENWLGEALKPWTFKIPFHYSESQLRKNKANC